MKPALLIGILLIVLGIGTLAVKQIHYKTQDTVIDLGPLHATAEREHTLSLPTILGFTLLAGGVVLVIVGSQSKG